MSKKVQKIASIVLIFILIFTMYTPLISANSSDISGHWAEKEIESSIEKEIAVGFPDGTFRPNTEISRAEFIAFVNRKFNFTEQAEVNYPDVQDKWYKEGIAIAIAADYISGFSDGTMRPEETITRQEVATILSRVLKLEEDKVATSIFNDPIPVWSKGYIGAVSQAKLMVGYPDGTFGPKINITRAEAIFTLDKVDSMTKTYNKAGIYGPKEGINTLYGTVIVDAEDITLQNLIIEGNLIISEKVGQGDVTLTNITVKGDTTINGGGANSIHLNDSNLNKVVINKNNVRLVLSDESSVEEVTVKTNTTLEGSKETSGFKHVIIDAEDNSTIILKGEYTTVTINSASKLELSAEATVKQLIVNQDASITGKGKIDQAEINVDGVTLEIIPNKIVVKDGVKNPITPPGTGSGGGGNYNPPVTPPPVDLEDITITSIESIEKTASIDDKIQLPATVQATMSDGSIIMKDVIWDGTAYTGDVGTFVYEGAVEGYSEAITYTLTVELSGYAESEDGKIAYVSTQQAFGFAQDIITVEEIYIRGNDIKLSEEFALPVIIDKANIILDLNENTLDKITIAANNITLKNGTINEVKYNNAENVTLDNIKDAPRTEHQLTGVHTLNLIGSTDLAGVLLIENGLELNGEGLVSGIVSIETIDNVTLSVPIETVIVEVEDAVVNVNNTINNMMVRQNSTVNVDSGSITNREKRENVTVRSTPKVETLTFMSTLSTSEDGFTAVVDRYDLNRCIGVAENFVLAAEPGSLDGQFPEDAIEALKISIEDAQTIIDSNPTQEAVNNEVVILRTALDTFGKSRIFLDTSSLRNKIRAMEQLLARTSIGTTYGHVPEDAHKEFEGIVDNVKDLYLKGLAKDEVKEQEDLLDSAHEVFQAAYIELPFFDPESTTIEGEMVFKLSDVDEHFTDSINFRSLSGVEYLGLNGWSVSYRDRSIILNKINFFNTTPNVIYYTAATNKNIYTGSFTIEEFKNKSEIQLVAGDLETGTISINVPSAGDDFIMTSLDVTKIDSNYSDAWHHDYQIEETTNLPVGEYIVKVAGYNEDSEYILAKEVNIKAEENKLVFSDTEFDIITIANEDFTGWDHKPQNYSAYNSKEPLYQQWTSGYDREINSTLIITDNLDTLNINFLAKHTEREEEWQYNVSIPRVTPGENETITTSPHFKFHLESFKDLEEPYTIDPNMELFNYFRVFLINDYDHQLTDLHFIIDGNYLEYNGEIIVKANGIEKSKKVDGIWGYNSLTIEDIFPGASGEVDITFSFNDTPFLIPAKTISVNVEE